MILGVESRVQVFRAGVGSPKFYSPGVGVPPIHREKWVTADNYCRLCLSCQHLICSTKCVACQLITVWSAETE